MASIAYDSAVAYDTAEYSYDGERIGGRMTLDVFAGLRIRERLTDPDVDPGWCV